MDGKPLVSVCFTCYNRKKYVAEAFQSVLNQTYSPLEIVVSDNCSTDGTYDIVRELISKYEKSNGAHKIILNQNTENIGAIKNIQKCFSLAHGELLVSANDDDISYPNRVERIVEEWLRGEKKSAVIHNGYVEIDADGKAICAKPPRGSDFPLGATASYIRAIIDDFGPIALNAKQGDDFVWTNRALMIGTELKIDDELERYRIGSGFSTKKRNYRDSVVVYHTTMLECARQLQKDVEAKKTCHDQTRIERIKKKCVLLSKIAEDQLILMSKSPVMSKYRACKRLIDNGQLPGGLVRIYIHGYVYMFPKWIADFQVKVYYFIKRVVSQGFKDGAFVG